MNRKKISVLLLIMVLSVMTISLQAKQLMSWDGQGILGLPSIQSFYGANERVTITNNITKSTLPSGCINAQLTLSGTKGWFDPVDSKVMYQSYLGTAKWTHNTKSGYHYRMNFQSLNVCGTNRLDMHGNIQN